MLVEKGHQGFELSAVQVALGLVAAPIAVDQIVWGTAPTLATRLHMVDADLPVGDLLLTVGTHRGISHDLPGIFHRQGACAVSGFAPRALQGLGLTRFGASRPPTGLPALGCVPMASIHRSADL